MQPRLSEISLRYNTVELNKQSDLPKVLLVDDVKMIRKSLKKMVNEVCIESKIRCSVECLTDGLEILTSVIKDQIEGNCKIKLVISDENMNWVNGSLAFKILSGLIRDHKLKHVNFVILTALEEEQILKNLKQESNASLIITKPINKYQLTEILSQYLN